MKQLETPLTWLLGIAFIAYIGISNFCSDQNRSDLLTTSQSKINIPILQEIESNINQPVLEQKNTEKITPEDFEELLYDSNSIIVIINDSSNIELELTDSLFLDTSEKLEK